MTEWIEQHIAAVEAHYELLIAGSDSRLEGGGKLWGQFTNAVKSYRERDKAEFSAVIERVNELAVARILLGDPTLTGFSLDNLKSRLAVPPAMRNRAGICLERFIVEKRKKAGLTQAVVAMRLGRQSFVATVESGQRRIDVIELIEFASAIGFDAAAG